MTDWIDAIKTGDMLQAKSNLRLERRGSIVDVSMDEVVLVTEVLTRCDNVAFKFIYRNEKFISSMTKENFSMAFNVAAKFDDALD